VSAGVAGAEVGGERVGCGGQGDFVSCVATEAGSSDGFHGSGHVLNLSVEKNERGLLYLLLVGAEREASLRSLK
jgi:hypothetical protein